MEVVRNLLGNLTAGIIRLLLTVGILAAVYFFLVRPALDTTEKISHEVNVSVQKGFEQSGPGDIGKTIEAVSRRVQREIKRSLRQTQGHGEANNPARCIQHAQNGNEIQRCNAKY